MSLPKSYYPALTGLRALAAYLVFFCHNAPDRIDWRWLPMHSWLSWFMEEWGVGVSIFFVLSGFLIATRYQDRVVLTAVWWRQYLRNRFARIYPMYALLTLVTFVLAIRPGDWTTSAGFSNAGSTWLLKLGLNLTFLKGFFDTYKFSGLLQGWSLTTEECFYVAAPFLLVGLRNKAWMLLLYAAGLLGVGAALLGVGQALKSWPVLGPAGFMSSPYFVLTYTFFGRCIEFLAGMGLALFLRKFSPKQRPSCGITTLGLLWLVACTALIATVRVELGASWETRTYVCIAINNVVLPFGIVLLLYGLMFERSWLRTLLETKLFDLLGRSSYVFYLIHMGFIGSFISVHLIGHPPVKLVELILVGIGLYILVEEPLRRRLTRSAPKPAFSGTHEITAK
jgi:peptidoglycan/LPS O-acetylase OafA/YrhL